ncbi:MAG: Hsp70 family protein, partial [Coriobacteriales bacterium]|nr:Hsp70 family protein [Coriobacteriales bacterium]
SLAYSTEQTLNELGDKVPADTKANVEEALAEAKKALDGTDIEAIKAAAEKLQQAGYKLAEIVYSDQQAQTGQAAAGNQPGGDDVVDADYEVVDE